MSTPGSRSVYGKAPTMQSHNIYTHCCLWKWPHRKANQFIRRCHPYARKSASQAILSRMKLTLHATRRTPHGASRMVLAMSAWSVKTRGAPFRHCRDARVYSRMTIDPRIPKIPGRSTSSFHRPGTHCLRQARSAVRCWASSMKGELHPTKNRF